jgi:NitT/TauT family transport system substrate-binding protein
MDRRTFLKQSGLFVVTTLSGSSFLVGCGTPQPAAPSVNRPTSLRNEIYLTPFQHIIAHIDVYVAMEKGWFEEQGLLIKPVGGTGTAASVSQVAAKQALYGKAASIITVPQIADQNVPLLSVGQVDQRSQYSVASLPERPLKHPRDWQGKSIGVISRGGTTELLLDAMSIMTGLDPNNVNKKVTGADAGSYEFLRRGEVDGFITFSGSETAFRVMGINLHYLNTDEFARVPGDAYIVLRETAEKDGQAVLGFLRAVKRAYEWLQDKNNHDEAIRIMGKWNPVEVEDRKLALAKIEAQVKLATPDPGGKLLRADPQAWEDGVRVMARAGIIKHQNLKATDCYTNRFVDQLS